MPDVTQALLLAAGEGSRLRPLTDLVPKPLLPIDGEPVIGTLVQQLHRHGISSFVVVIGPTGAMIREHLERSAPAGCSFTFVEQPVANGSADAIQHGLTALDETAPSMVAACDTVWRDEDVAAMLDAHASLRPMVTMAARSWPLEQLPHRSCLTLADDGRLLRVLEKPGIDEVTSALSGSPLYVVEPAFWPYVRAVEAGSHGKKELATALQASIDAGDHLQSVEVHDTRDLTRPLDLLRANFPYLAELLPELPPT
jgi:bifunctional UDP-N-acetylglucosamine pyrophosphorylase/glucosamine-1-phosphate N-acetyltransferase